jgi:hypothetical protein
LIFLDDLFTPIFQALVTFLLKVFLEIPMIFTSSNFIFCVCVFSFVCFTGARWSELNLSNQQCPERDSNSWIVQDVNISKLPCQNVTTNTLCLFMRDASWELFNLLERFHSQSCRRTLWISGPPGVGKSSLLFGWAHLRASLGKIVVWVHSIGDNWYVAKLQDTVAKCTKINALDISAVSSICLLCQDTQIVIVDAVREKMRSLLLALCEECASLLIASTSYRGSFSSEESVMVNCEFHLMMSWTLRQYEEAGPKLFPSLSLDELHELYCYAGGSLRLMLYLNTNLVKSFLNEKIAKVVNPADLLSGLAGMSSSHFVNALMQMHNDGVFFPVSDYARHRLVERNGLQFVTAAKMHLPSNPSYQGWIFELEFITCLQLAKKTSRSLTLKFRSGPETSLTIDHLEWYSNAQEEPLVCHERGNSIFLPIKWNQGCFDAVYHWKEETKPCFAFISCTIAASHDCKLQFVADFLAKLYTLGECASCSSSSTSHCQVHFWVVTKEEVARLYNHGNVESVESVQNFDPNFSFDDNNMVRVGWFDPHFLA